MEAGELRQHLQGGGIDGEVRVTATQYLGAFAGDVLRLHQERHRYAPGVQRTADDQRALGDEQGVGRVGPVDQLVSVARA